MYFGVTGPKHEDIEKSWIMTSCGNVGGGTCIVLLSVDQLPSLTRLYYCDWAEGGRARNEKLCKVWIQYVPESVCSLEGTWWREFPGNRWWVACV